MDIESVADTAAGETRLLRAIALFAGVFGTMTIRASALALFGGVDAGAAVPFVLWFNFLAGFGYVAAAFGLWTMQPWAAWLSAAIAASTAVVFAMFGLHVATGGAFETRTVIAMSLRTACWCAIAWLGLRWLVSRDAGE
jgi:hypothetical protein